MRFSNVRKRLPKLSRFKNSHGTDISAAFHQNYRQASPFQPPGAILRVNAIAFLYNRWQRAEKIDNESKINRAIKKNIWKIPSEFPTDLVEKCYRYRKISISELTNEQIRLLISQKIGTEYLIGIALEKLEQNVF